jgi:glutamyl-Q tRNA(Asp) synthetase
MTLLGLTVPHYAHIPCLEFADGTKLSKQTHAPALNNDAASVNLTAALWYLGLQVPNTLASVAAIVSWAVQHFSLAKIPQRLPTYQPLDT